MCNLSHLARHIKLHPATCAQELGCPQPMQMYAVNTSHNTMPEPSMYYVNCRISCIAYNMAMKFLDTQQWSLYVKHRIISRLMRHTEGTVSHNVELAPSPPFLVGLLHLLLKASLQNQCFVYCCSGWSAGAVCACQQGSPTLPAMQLH